MTVWRTKIVALCGVAGAGKSTVASLLATDMGYRPVRLTARLDAMMASAGVPATHLAHPLKDQPMAILGGSTPRQFAIDLGAFIRARNPTFFPDAWREDIRALIAATPVHQRLFVVDNLRLQAEYEAVKAEGALVIRIVPKFERPPAMMRTYVPDEVTEAQDFPADETVINDSTIGTMMARVKAALMFHKFI